MTFVKICGLTNLDDALCAVDAGADLLGFIFYARSPRAASASDVGDIATAARARAVALGRAIACVGVFVNETPGHLLGVLQATGLDFAQLSGDEPPEQVRAMDGRAFKAVRRAGLADVCAAAAGTPPNAPDVLLDADHATLYGGSGQRADASLARALAGRWRLLLAGGLNPENVAEAIHAAQPWGVDVASGTEAAPGRKDPARVRAFVAAAKRAR